MGRHGAFTAAIVVSVEVNAPVARVWSDLADIATHVEWMDDAESITFTGTKTTGLGTTFQCITKFGRFRLEDEMMVTDWTEGRRLSVQHDGVVKGAGSFTLAPIGTGTLFSWEEDLTFPLYLGGPLGELIARPVIVRTWQTNLLSLKSRVEGPPGLNPIAYFAERGVTLITKPDRKRTEWTVTLHAPAVDDFTVADYATGPAPFAARAAALMRWQAEEEPPPSPEPADSSTD